MQEAPRKIIRNTLGTSVSFAFAFTSNLFLLPYIVHTLGSEYYGGIWVIIGTLTAYLGLLDLGTGTAFVKFIAEHHARSEFDEVLAVVNTGLFVYLGVAAVLIPVGFIFDKSILRLVGVPDSIMTDAQFVFRIGLIVFALANVASPITSILTAIQRMDINAYVSMFVQTIFIVGTVTALHMGMGVRGLILNNLVVAVLNSAILGMLAFRHVPSLRLSLAYVRRAKAATMIRYGFNLQVGRFADLVLFQTDRILNLKLFGIFFSTHYDIAAKLNNSARSICGLLISALIPAFAEFDALQDRARLFGLYLRGSKYIAVAGVFIFAFVAAFAPGIVTGWMGSGFGVTAEFVRVLSFGYFINIVTGVASSMAAGLGKTEFNRKFGIFVSVFNIIATITLALRFGPIGIAAGTTLSLTLGAVYFMRMFHNYAHVESKSVLLLFLKPLVAAPFSVASAWGLARLLLPHPATRLEVLFGVGLEFIGYAAMFALLALLLRIFDDYDRDIMRTLYRKAARPFSTGGANS